MFETIGATSLLGIPTAIKFFAEKVGGPVVEDFLTSKSTVSLSSVGNEVRDRLRTNLPINHDVERAVRVAQLQALRLTLKHYEKIVSATKNHQPIDDGVGSIFANLLNNYLNTKFFRRAGVELERHTFEKAYTDIAADISIGSGVPDALSDNSVDLVIVDTLILALETNLNLAESKTGIRSIPEGFCRLLREGHRTQKGSVLPSWPVTYRAFLCEQVKANQRFRDIFQTTMLVTINEMVADGFASLNEASTQLRAELQSQTETHLKAMEDGFEVIGSQLAAVKAELAVQSKQSDLMTLGLSRIENRLADLVFAISEQESIDPVLQKVLGAAYEVIGTESHAASERIANRHLQNPIYGRGFDRENLDQFLNWQDRGILLLTGDAGAGKSRLMAEMAAAWDQPGQTVLRHFFSMHESHWGSRDLMIANLARQAAQKLGPDCLGEGEPGDLKRLADRLSSLLAKDRKDDRLILVIDSLDEAAEPIEPFQVPLGAGVYILLSIRADEEMLPRLAQKWLNQTLNPRRLSRQHYLEMIDSNGIANWLTGATGESYYPTDDLVQRALRACDGVPLFAEFLIPSAITALKAGKKDVMPESFDTYVRTILEGLIDLDINPGQTGWSLQSTLDLFGLAAVAKAALPARICQIAANGGRLDKLDARIARWFILHHGKSGLLLALRHPRLVEVFLRVLPQLDVSPSDCRESLIKVLREHRNKSEQIDAHWHAVRWLPSYLLDAGLNEDAADLLGDLAFMLDRLRQRPEAFEISSLASETINLNSELDGHHKDLASLSRFWSETETTITKACQTNYVITQRVFDQIRQIIHDRPLRVTFLEQSDAYYPSISLQSPQPYLHPNLFRAQDNAHSGAIVGIQQIGDRIVSWGDDGSLRFWSLTGQAMEGGDLKAHSGGIRGIQQIGDRIVSWGADGALRFWSLTGQAMEGGDLKAHSDGIRGIQQIGDRIVSWGADGALRFWSLTGQAMEGGDLKAHSGGIRGIQQIGDRIVSWGIYGELRFWSLTGQAIEGGDLEAHLGGILGIQQIGDRIVSWGADGALRFWSLTGQAMEGGDLKAHSDGIRGIQQIGDRIVSWGIYGELRFWSLTGQAVEGGDLEAHFGGIWDIQQIEDRIVSWGNNVALRCGSLTGQAMEGSDLWAHSSAIDGIQQIGDRIVSWGYDGALRFWSLTGHAMEGGDLNAHSGGIRGIQQIGDRIVSWGYDGALRFWSLTGHAMEGGDLRANSGAIVGIQQIGDRIVSWSIFGELRFWSLMGQAMEGGDLKAHSGLFNVIGGIQQIGDHIVSWGEDGALRFWSLAGQAMEGGDLKAHSGAIVGIQQIGDRIVSWGGDGVLRFWSLTGQAMEGGDLKAHSGGIRGIQQIGDRIVSWGYDGALRFWSLTGHAMEGGDLKAHSDGIRGIQQIGDRIVSWGADGALRFWSLTGQAMKGGDLKAHSFGMGAIVGIQQIGDRIVSWGGDGALRFWSLMGQAMEGGDLKAHSGFFDVIRGIQQIGDRIVSWGGDGALRFWSLTGQAMEGGDLEAHLGRIVGIRQIGDRIVSWGEDGALRFWSLTGQAMEGGDLKAHSGAIVGIQQIGDRIVSWGGDGVLRFWSLTGENLLLWWSPSGKINGIQYIANTLYLLHETGPIPFVFEESKPRSVL